MVYSLEINKKFNCLTLTSGEAVFRLDPLKKTKRFIKGFVKKAAFEKHWIHLSCFLAYLSQSHLISSICAVTQITHATTMWLLWGSHIEDTDASQEYMLYEMYITFSIYSPKETSVYFQISLRSFLFYFCLTVSGCVLISCIHYLGFRMCGKPTSLMGPNHQQMFNLFPIRRLPTLIPQKSA